jgi:hypothetical protein
MKRKGEGEGEERLKLPHWKLKIGAGDTGHWQHFSSSTNPHLSPQI